MPCARAAVGPQRTEQESDRFVTLMYDSHLGLASVDRHTHRYPLSVPINREAHPVPRAGAAVSASARNKK